MHMLLVKYLTIREGKFSVRHDYCLKAGEALRNCETRCDVSETHHYQATHSLLPLKTSDVRARSVDISYNKTVSSPHAWLNGCSLGVLALVACSDNGVAV